jgi:putative hydrolase of the HAD superfamily
LRSGHERIGAVALDAMGVIYSVADDLRDLLIPYLRARGCTAPDGVLIDAYRACYRDGAPSRSIWDLAGRDWADGALERDFLACYELNEGVIEFLRAMQAHSLPVYGLSNDVGEWAAGRRQMLGIDDYFAGWAISSEVRSHKPEPAIYQHLLALLPCEPGACLFVDDRLSNLEAARDAGMQATWFSSQPSEAFPSVSGFAALTALVLEGNEG